MNGSTLHAHNITRGHLTLVHSAPEPGLHGSSLQGPGLHLHDAGDPEPARNLNSLDMITLQRWMRRSDTHGYSRMLIEVGAGFGEPEEGGYALLYEPGQDWATWGVARNGPDLVVWHCASGADQGRHATMQEALDSLPVIWRGISRSRDAASKDDARSTVVRLA